MITPGSKGWVGTPSLWLVGKGSKLCCCFGWMTRILPQCDWGKCIAGFQASVCKCLSLFLLASLSLKLPTLVSLPSWGQQSRMDPCTGGLQLSSCPICDWVNKFNAQGIIRSPFLPQIQVHSTIQLTNNMLGIFPGFYFTGK